MRRSHWKLAAGLAAAATATGLVSMVGPAGSAPGRSGSPTAQAAAAVHHRTLTSAQDETLRAKATDTQLVVGTALRGVPMDVTSVVSKGLRKAYVYGHVQHCAWLLPGVKTSARHGPVRHTCSGFTALQIADYAKRVNCLPHGHSPAWLSKHYPQSNFCRDGSPARITLGQPGCGGAAPVFANIQPWHSTAHPADQYGTLPDGTAVKWRYVARDTNWVLVHGPTLQPGQSHWYFVRRTCVSAPSVHNPHSHYHPLTP